jgi:hypothetical protein
MRATEFISLIVAEWKSLTHCISSKHSSLEIDSSFFQTTYRVVVKVGNWKIDFHIIAKNPNINPKLARKTHFIGYPVLGEFPIIFLSPVLSLTQDPPKETGSLKVSFLF